MSESARDVEQKIREAAYFIWEREGRPDGCAQAHWERALLETRRSGECSNDDEGLPDEEKILAGRLDVNMPALLTKDVIGG